VCEIESPKQKQGNKILLLLGFVLLFFGTYKALGTYKYGMNKPHLTQAQKDAKEFEEEDEDVQESTVADKDCVVPQFAIDIGHRDMWLEHNGCPPVKQAEVMVPVKKEVMKTPIPLASVQMKTSRVRKTIETSKATEQKQKESDCIAPEWAVKIGHKEMWEEHNCK
jgi:hypothetical protein